MSEEITVTISKEEHDKLLFHSKMYKELDRRIHNVMTYASNLPRPTYKILHQLAFGNKPNNLPYGTGYREKDE